MGSDSKRGGEIVKAARIEAMKKAREEKQEARTYIEFDNIIIKSYEAGWMLNINNEDTRYYSSLTGLFKKLFSIKLSRKRIDDLQAIYQAQKDVLREIVEMASRLDEEIKK